MTLLGAPDCFSVGGACSLCARLGGATLEPRLSIYPDLSQHFFLQSDETKSEMKSLGFEATKEPDIVLMEIWLQGTLGQLYLFEEEVIGEVVEDHRVGGVKGVGFGQ